jgi:epoxyqueuosine reductase QueG
MLHHKTVWGCDLCQTACPHTRRVIRDGYTTPIPFFHESRIPRLTSETLDAMDPSSFKTRAFSWRGRATIARNLAAYEQKNGEE